MIPSIAGMCSNGRFNLCMKLVLRTWIFRTKIDHVGSADSLGTCVHDLHFARCDLLRQIKLLQASWEIFAL